MSIRDMLIVFGRVNSIPTLFTEPFGKEIVQMVKSKTKYHYRDYYWVFGNIVIDNMFLAGRFGKYKIGEKDIVYDAQKSEFREETFEKMGRAFYSNFAIDLKSKVIIFEERKGGITISGFMNAFHRYSLETSKEFEIKLLVETVEFYQILKHFNKVTKVEIRVNPANPHDEPEFRRIQKILEEAKADKAMLELEGKEGLEIEKSIIHEGIEMSEKGYSDLKITGESEGRIKKVASKDKTLKTLLQKVTDDPKEILKRFADEIKKKF